MAVIGLARAGDAHVLKDADLVVATLDEVDLGAFSEGRLAES